MRGIVGKSSETFVPDDAPPEIERSSYDLDGDIDNLTLEEAALWAELLEECVIDVFPEFAAAHEVQSEWMADVVDPFLVSPDTRAREAKVVDCIRTKVPFELPDREEATLLHVFAALDGHVINTGDMHNASEVTADAFVRCAESYFSEWLVPSLSDLREQFVRDHRAEIIDYASALEDRGYAAR